MKTMKTAGVLAAAAMAVMPALVHAGQRVTVEKNHTLRVTLAAPAGTVVVGNPDIADVTVVDSRTIYIVGKGFGNSAVTVAGRDGRSLFDGDVTVTAAQRGAITVYKGLKPSLMVCTNVCIAEDATQSNTSVTAPPVLMGAPAPQGAPAPSVMAIQ